MEATLVEGPKRQEDGAMPATDLAIPLFSYKSHVSINRKFRRIRQ